MISTPVDSPRGRVSKVSKLDDASKVENSAVRSGYHDNSCKEPSGFGEEKLLDAYCCHSSISQQHSVFSSRISPSDENSAKAVRSCHSQPLSMMEQDCENMVEETHILISPMRDEGKIFLALCPGYIENALLKTEIMRFKNDLSAEGLMKEAKRFLILSNIDRLWKKHLQALKFVQQVVGLRGYAQRDPLIEYKLEGYNLFLDMMAQIRRNFKPVMVKKDEDDKSDKLVTNGKSNNRKSDPIDAVESSSSTASPQASA